MLKKIYLFCANVICFLMKPIQYYKARKAFKQQYNRNASEFLAANNELANKHKGKRCFVVGNAPSLNSQDLSLLKDEIVITVNQISRLNDFSKMKSNYHFWADPKFFNISLSENPNELLDVMTSVVTEDNSPICFFPLMHRSFVLENKLDKKLTIKYFLTGASFDGKSNENLGFTNTMSGFNTVVDYGICLGLFMGCSEIYLLGCDCTGISSFIDARLQSASSEGYAYDITSQEKKRMTNMLNSVSLEDAFMGWSLVFKQYRLLNDYCIKTGVKLVNCTNGGILDLLPREMYEDIIVQK